MVQGPFNDFECIAWQIRNWCEEFDFPTPEIRPLIQKEGDFRTFEFEDGVLNLYVTSPSKSLGGLASTAQHFFGLYMQHLCKVEEPELSERVRSHLWGWGIGIRG